MQRVIEYITVLWRKTPVQIRAGWITAWITFTGSLLTIVTGLLPSLANAISDKNFEPFLDSLNVGATAALSAALGFFAGLVNGVYRWLRPIQEAYQTPPGS